MRPYILDSMPPYDVGGDLEENFVLGNEPYERYQQTPKKSETPLEEESGTLNFRGGVKKFGQFLKKGVTDGLVAYIRESTGKLGRYAIAFTGNVLGPVDERKADYIVAVKDPRYPTYRVAFVQSHGELIDVNDVHVDEKMEVLMDRGERLQVNGWIDVYDDRYEQFGAAQTFPSFRLFQERRVREGLVEMDLGYLIGRRTIARKIDENGQEIRLCKPENIDLGRGFYLTYQGLLHEPIIGAYKGIVNLIGKIGGGVMRKALDKSINEEGFVYDRFRAVSGNLATFQNLPPPHHIKPAA